MTRGGVRARARADGSDRADPAARRLAAADARPARRPARPAPPRPALARAQAATRSSRRGRARKTVPRKLVVLCDVSGSMDAYARALLLFLHAIVGTGHGVEAFGVRHAADAPHGRSRHPRSRGGARAAAAVAVDWGSGTRIGASLEGVQRPLRPSRALARRRRRDRLGRLGAGGSGARRPGDGASSRGRRTRSSGSIR